MNNKMEIENILKKEKDLVLDTGILISYFTGEKPSIISFLDRFIFSEKSYINLHGNQLLKSEIYYIICRMKGIEKAKEVNNKVEEIINIISETNLFEIAAQIKCKYPIAIADCYSIATGIFKNCPIFFLKEEELSDKRIKKIDNEFNSRIYILE